MAGMRIVIGILCAAVLVTGCAKFKRPAPVTVTVQPGKPVVTPDFRAIGTIMTVNAEARYVIVSFPVTNVPPAGRRLDIYRNGLKVGELKVTGPEREGDTAADLVAGEAQVRDEAREP